jgi:hypothetical protein
MHGNYGEQKMYTFYAYRDPKGIDDGYSENLLRIQIMNVTGPGTYFLDGSYKEDFDSYILFKAQLPGNDPKLYINDPLRSQFQVKIDQQIPIKDSPSKGVIGSFWGTLYDEDNPADSLVIENGKFIFRVVNYHDHCGF